MNAGGRFDIRPIRWAESHLELLDQRALPETERWVACSDAGAVTEAIRDMTVRGAPAIGVAAAYGVALAGACSDATTPAALLADVEAAAAGLRAARPTAVNLAWAVDRMIALATEAVAAGQSVNGVRTSLLSAAGDVDRSDYEACRALGRFGAQLLPDTVNVLTHCNAGALATAGYGTALGVVRAAVESGKSVHVWVDETRPFLQGARLTAWELTEAGIPNTLLVDAAGPALIAGGRVDVVVVGADRIAANGDVANKIGTYSLALAAAANDVPFVVAAPVSTVDLACAEGSEITIEDRGGDEVLAGSRTVRGQRAINPAFDVTPARYVTAIVTERGIARPPYTAALAVLVA